MYISIANHLSESVYMKHLIIMNILAIFSIDLHPEVSDIFVINLEFVPSDGFWTQALSISHNDEQLCHSSIQLPLPVFKI